jgi:hypothetical protein
MSGGFGIVRLGKNSVDHIREIDSYSSLSLVNFDINLHCTQVTGDLLPSDCIFIWLGSDNSKGQNTSWEKGLRAIGVLAEKSGGPSFKDDWDLIVNVRLILPGSLAHRDYLHLGATYEAFSDIPVLGLNTYSNQLAQYITPSPRRDVRALLFALGSLVPTFKMVFLSAFPHLALYLEYSPDVPSHSSKPESALSSGIDDQVIEIENPEGLDTSTGSYNPYPIDAVFVRAEPRTAFEVLRRINGKSYILNPSFQRDFIWSEEKQSKFIESAIMRIPLPPFYLSERRDGKVVVVDGLQRLTTFQRFVNGDLKLKGLTGFGHQYNGAFFNELPETMKTRIEDVPLTLYLIDAKVTERARLDIFERVNSGVPLTRQQMRNALYNGHATEFLRTAAASQCFISATGGSLQTISIKNQMRDREIINRFCAFLIKGPEDYDGDMDAFLGSVLEIMSSSGDLGITALQARFTRAMNNNKLIFGRQAFRKHTSQEQSRSVINVALFEVMAVALADADESLILEKASVIRTAFYNLMNSRKFMDAISLGTADTSRVRTRFSLALTEIGAAIND